MPKRRSELRPLPSGWDIGRDYDGKIYYINHIDKRTTWIDPRDSISSSSLSYLTEYTEWSPMLPGLSKTYTPSKSRRDELSDWRTLQETMLESYLVTAETDLRTKEELALIKGKRLVLAKEEYNHLQNSYTSYLSNTSLNSTGSSTLSNKYDPNVLRADVQSAKSRVLRLKRELATIDSEMSMKQKGVETLMRVNDKFQSIGSSSEQDFDNGSHFTLEEAVAIRLELSHVQKSLTTGENEKIELMKSLSALKDDLTRLSRSETYLENENINSELLSTASQTDLSGEIVPLGARLAEMARLRLRYDDARKKMMTIQKRLSSLEERMSPGQLESDQDRLLLIQEKEQLLRELRSPNSSSSSSKTPLATLQEISQLESDVNNANEVSNRSIAQRLKLHEEKQSLLSQLMDSMRTVASLESQLKSLSASTLSMSSSSSLGSLSSSKGSLSSLSFSDIYGLPVNTSYDIPLFDVQRRLDKLVFGPESSFSSTTTTTTPPLTESPTKGIKVIEPLEHNRKLSTFSKTQNLYLSSISESYYETPSLSPFSSSSSKRRNSIPFESSESVTGDSGVFESSSPCVSAQVQIHLTYGNSLLRIGIDKLRKVSKLFHSQITKLCIKVALLPISSSSSSSSPSYSSPSSSPSLSSSPYYITTHLNNLSESNFSESEVSSTEFINESLSYFLPPSCLSSKNLQISLWSLSFQNEGSEERKDCLGFAIVSLSDLISQGSSLRWYKLRSSSQFPELLSSSEQKTSCQRPYEESKEERRMTKNDSQSSETTTLLSFPSSSPTIKPLSPHYSDKETNTESFSEKASSSRVLHQDSSDSIVKRSLTFSQSDSFLNTNYLCRLNRSDSDSAMPAYKRLSSSQSSSFERRSLRLKGSSRVSKTKGESSVVLTPLDLELDLAAQKTKLEVLAEEIKRLKVIKAKMEEAKTEGKGQIPSWLLEQESFQNLLTQVQLQSSKSSQDKKIEKMLRRTERDIYKYRQNNTPKGELEARSFREKMAFLTSLRAKVPIISSDDDDETEREESSRKRQQNPPPRNDSTNKISEKESQGSDSASLKFTYEIDPVIGVIV